MTLPAKAVLAPAAVVMAALLMLGGCASQAPAVHWKPRADADLKSDLAACTKDAESVDQRMEQSYSDSRYGAAAAMTGRLDQNDMTGRSMARMYDAIVYSCMTRKGWQAP